METLNSQCSQCTQLTKCYNYLCHALCNDCQLKNIRNYVQHSYSLLTENPIHLNGYFRVKCPYQCENSGVLPHAELNELIPLAFSKDQNSSKYLQFFNSFRAYFIGIRTTFWVCKTCAFINGATSDEEYICSQCSGPNSCLNSSTQQVEELESCDIFSFLQRKVEESIGIQVTIKALRVKTDPNAEEFYDLFQESKLALYRPFNRKKSLSLKKLRKSPKYRELIAVEIPVLSPGEQKEFKIADTLKKTTFSSLSQYVMKYEIDWKPNQ